MLSINETALDNAMNIVTVEQPHLHSASVALLVKSGSRYEAYREWGLSHLVEHMLFRGSRAYPDGRSLARAFEKAGGVLQASTWRDHTSLSISLHPSHLQNVLNALADMVAHPLFEGLDVEREIVEEELQAELDEEGHDIDLNNISRASIWRSHPMGRRITGSIDTVRSFTRDDVERHHTQHYVGANAALCVAGRVDSKVVNELAAQAFGKLPRGTRTLEGEAARFEPRTQITTRPGQGSQLSIQISFEALPDVHPDFVALGLLSSILDGGMGSRLQQAVCERKGLVYELNTGLDCYADCGLYDIEMKVAPRRASSAIAATFEVLQNLCSQGVQDEEFEMARERALHEMEFRVDSAEELSAEFATNSLFNRLVSDGHEAERLAAVRPDDVVRVARELFFAGRIHATLMGPVERANMRRIEKVIEGFQGRLSEP